MERKIAVLGMLAVLVSGPADAQSLKVKQDQKRITAALEDALAITNEACGTSIVQEMDWAAFPAEDFETNYSINGYCQAPIDALYGLCTSTYDDAELNKQIITEKISKIVCSRGDERNATLDAGVLTYTIQYDAADNDAFIRQFLYDNL